MRNIIGFALGFSGMAAFLYAFIVLELIIFGQGNKSGLFFGMIIYGVIAMMASWIVWKKK